MLRGLVVLLSIFVSFGAVSNPALAEKRVALVVGNDIYDKLPPKAQLQKARLDAAAVAKTLKGLGFDVIEGRDATRSQFNELWQEFLNRLAPGDIALFFFAGHGVELGGQNFILPRDVPSVRAGQEERLRRESLLLQEFLWDLRERKTRINLVILDACRDNPFEEVAGRTIGGKQGLVMKEPPEGTFIMFSAGTGQTALDRLSDDDPVANSVYTRHLLPLLETRGIELEDIAKRVRIKVRDDALTLRHNQTPAYYNQVLGSYCVAGEGGACGEAAATPASPTAPRPDADTPPAATTSRTEPAAPRNPVPPAATAKAGAGQPAAQGVVTAMAEDVAAAAFAKARDGGTSEAMRLFLEAHPGSADGETALRDLRAYERAAALTDSAPLQERVSAFEAYIAAFPEGLKSADAQRHIARLRATLLKADCDAFAKDAVTALAEMTTLGCAGDAKGDHWDPDTAIHRSYCHRLKDKKSEQAEQRAKELAGCRDAKKRRDTLAAALQANTPDALRDFLRSWPDGPGAGDARTKLDALEDAAWALASKTPTTETLTTFLKQHPDGRRAAEAKTVKEALQAAAKKRDDEAFAAARKADTPDAYAKYNADFPAGLHSGDVKPLAEDAKAWNEALATKSAVAYRAYAKAKPESRFAALALKLADDLEQAELVKACDSYAAAAIATLKEAEHDSCVFTPPADRTHRFSLDPARHTAFCRTTEAATRDAEASERTRAVRACTRPRRDRESFDYARRSGTPEAVWSYLRTREFSDSPNRPAAEAKLTELCEAAWPAARKTATWASLTRYGNHACATGPHQDEARRLLSDIDEKAWSKAKQADSKTSYAAYIKSTGGGSEDDSAFARPSEGKYQAKAEEALAAIAACETARKETDADQLKSFLDENPSSRCLSEIKQKHAELAASAKRRDDAAWSKAQDTDTIESYQKYIEEFSDWMRNRTPLHADAANAKIQELQGWADTSFSWTRERLKARAADASNANVRRLAVLYDNGQLAFFDAGTGQLVSKEKLTGGTIVELPTFSFSSNGRWLVVTFTEEQPRPRSKRPPEGLDDVMDSLKGASVETTTLLFDGAGGGRQQTWSGFASAGFADNDKVLQLNSARQDGDGFDWDLAKSRKRPRSDDAVLIDSSSHARLPTNPTAEDEAPAQLSATIDFDGNVSLNGGGSSGDIYSTHDTTRARFVMLTSGDHFVYTPGKQYSGSAGAIAATRIATQNGEESKIPDGFRRRFHKADNLDILGATASGRGR